MRSFRNLAVVAVAALAVAVAPGIATGCQTKTLSSARPAALIVLGQMTSNMNNGPDVVNVPLHGRLARKEAAVIIGYPGKRITIRPAGGKRAGVEICNY